MAKNLLRIITSSIFLLLTNLSFAQAPNLGTAANFVLFSSNGAVSNTGISQLTGNVGTNNGSSTGFGNVNGVMHDNDGASNQAAADLLIAYNQLNNAIATFFPAPLLGNGDTLNAGIYKISGVTTLNGNLVLNAQGNANAVFIFQIQAAFSANAASKVKLINGAQACNVFWKVEGQVSMASATSFKGTVIANNAAITMNTNDTLEGRALSTAGAVTVSGVLAYTPTGCGSPLLTGPAAPNLASTVCYALFSGNGSVTNSGVTYVKGNIGTNVGLVTGYDPLKVNGTIHPIPDGSTAACATDLLNVYNYLNTLPNDIELLYPAQFGRSLVLTPHTYIMNGAVTFTDSLYLNAEGNANAAFVIKINGALNTSTFSKVLLINGAQAKNVYWKVDGAVNINNNSVFKGTIVCNNGAISITTGTDIEGRALTTNGQLTTAASVVNITDGCSSITPVTWLYFRGQAVQKTVVLNWATASETNNSFFTIEKSKDGKTFETLTTVVASREVRSEHAYSFSDNNPYKTTYYRLSQTDKNGQTKYFTTIQVRSGATESFEATQYVQGNYIYVQTSGASAGNASILLYSIEGRKVSSQKVVLTEDVNLDKVTKPVQAGLYILQIERNGVKLFTGKVMVP